MSSQTCNLAQPILQEAIPRNGHSVVKAVTLFTLLLSVAAFCGLQNSSQDEVPLDLWATAAGRMPMAAARVPFTVQKPWMIPSFQKNSVPFTHNPRVPHISCRARNGDSRIVIRADDIEAKVKKLIAENLSVDEDKITPEASFIEDLGADSLDTVELLMAMEEEFGCEIPEEEAQKLTTVKAVIDYAKDKA